MPVSLWPTVLPYTSNCRLLRWARSLFRNLNMISSDTLVGMADKNFEDQVIWLPELTKDQPTDMLDGYTFKNCVLRGPGVLLVVGKNTFGGCSFDSADAFFSVDVDRNYFGMVGAINCEFIDTRFERLGIAGHQDFVSRMLSDFMGG